MKSVLLLAAVGLLFLSAAPTALASAPTVSTPYGEVYGAKAQGAYSFKGIPYAAPPVGDLRFAATQEVNPWPGPWDATKFAPGCMAYCPLNGFPRPDIMCTPTTSEDCLYLNIYTPTLNTSANLPVIIFIHGGNYFGGSGGVPIYDGTGLAVNENVVVVTINYRLGLIGGLYTGTVLGNFQTMDQRQSMKWVQKSISSFGGNPNKVTITGQSAGAFSVAVHLTSPYSWPYFQHAIIVSNPFSLPASDPEMAIKLGVKVLTKLGCPIGGDAELKCLRAANATYLQELSNTVDYSPLPSQFLGLMMQWVPVVDGDQVPYQPLHALTHGNFSKVPTMLGTVANESVQFIYGISPKPLNVIGYDYLVDAVWGKDAAAVNKEYGSLPLKDWGDARPFLSVLATDYIFYCVSRYVGAALTELTDTFMYYFDRMGSWNKWVFGKEMPYCVDAVCHASDLPFIFDPFTAPSMANITVPSSAEPDESEKGLIRFMQTVWGNFAHNGNPNKGKPLPHANGASFPHFNGTKNILVNESTPVSMLDGYRDSQCDFWNGLRYSRW